MILKRLEIKLKQWGSDAGKYEGQATFVNGKGEISLELTKEHCDKIFDICADNILEVANEAAMNMHVAVIDHVNQRALENEK